MTSTNSNTNQTEKQNNDYQSKCFSFTWNNYSKTINWKEMIENFATTYCEDFFYAEEEAPTTGTEHLQGYFRLSEKKRKNTVNNLLENKLHLERSKKCRLANFRYCSKTGLCWVFNKTSGFQGFINTKQKQKIDQESKKHTPKQGKSYQICVTLAKQGKFDSILNEYPQIYLQYENKLKALFIDMNKTQRLFLGNEYGPFFKNHFLWLWGKTGTGKSYYCNVVVDLLNAFYKTLSNKRNTPFKRLRVYYKNKNKWWDKYTNEEIVIIEEASPETFKTSAHYYKQWIDEYPFNPEIKGATLDYIRPKFIIITSNYTLKQCCSEDGTENTTKLEDYEPLQRRFMEIHLKDKEIPKWPNFYKLALYENTIDLVKFNYINKIDNIIENMKFSEVINHGEEYLEEYKLKRSALKDPATPILKRKRTYNNLKENIPSTPKKNKGKDPEIYSQSPLFSSPSNSNESDYPSTPCPSPTYTIMVWNRTDWDYTHIYCIHCFTHITSGLFCKQCSTINDYKEISHGVKLAKCNYCFDYFTCLIDAHCPGCTTYLKKRYKHVFPNSDEILPSEPDYYDNKHFWWDANKETIKKNHIEDVQGLLLDSFGNVFKSMKQLKFIYRQMLKIYKNVKIINNTLNPLKNPKDQETINKIVLENDNLINKYDLRCYSYYPIKRRWRTTDELSQISNNNKCYHCQMRAGGIIINTECYCKNRNIENIHLEQKDEDYDFDIFQEQDYQNEF